MFPVLGFMTKHLQKQNQHLHQPLLDFVFRAN